MKNKTKAGENFIREEGIVPLIGHITDCPQAYKAVNKFPFISLSPESFEEFPLRYFEQKKQWFHRENHKFWKVFWRFAPIEYFPYVNSIYQESWFPTSFSAEGGSKFIQTRV